MKYLLFILLPISIFASNFASLVIRDSSNTYRAYVKSDSSLRIATNDTFQIRLNSSDSVQTWNGTQLMEMDNTTGAVKTVNYSISQINNGRHFFVGGYTNLASANDSIDFCVFTRNQNRWAHMGFNFYSEKELIMRVYEDATWDTTTGVTVNARNSDRNSVNESVLLIKTSPTISDIGTCIDSTKIGSGNVPSRILGGTVGRESKLILKQNTY